MTEKIENLPRHIAIIPDGNRRWAKAQGLRAREAYYKSGSYENLHALFNEAKRLGVKYFSIWGFSTENWKRDTAEINDVFRLILKGLQRFNKESSKEKIRFQHAGRKDRLPKEIVTLLKQLEEETRQYKDFTVQLCLDYGGRDELIRAIKKLSDSNIKDIDEKSFSNYLDTKGIPEPDLIIRTGGERRLSGFMPYQSVYAEFHFTNTYFPDFGPKELRKAIEEFSQRQRRFGGD